MAAARADTGSSPADEGAERPRDRRLISVSASSSGVQLASHATATCTLSCPAGLRRERCTHLDWSPWQYEPQVHQPWLYYVSKIYTPGKVFQQPNYSLLLSETTVF